MSYNESIQYTAWGLAAMDILPYEDWSTVDLSKPRTHIFQGGGYWNSILLVSTAALLIYIIILCTVIREHNTRNFVVILILPIALNLIPRSIKNIYLICQPWPDAFCLYVLTAIELTLCLMSHINIVSSIFSYTALLLINISKTEPKALWTPYILNLSVSVIVSILYFNFNRILVSIPFYLYFTTMWIFNFLNLIMLFLFIPIALLSCDTNKNSEIKQRLIWIYPFVFIAIIPYSYNTALIVIDFLFAVFKTYADNPGGYVEAMKYRSLAFGLQPLFVMVAILIMIPCIREKLLFCLRRTKNMDVQVEPANTSIQNFVKHSPEHIHKVVIPDNNIGQLNPLFFPGSISSDTNKTVIAGALHRLDPDIYPGASPKPLSPLDSAGSVTVIITPKPPGRFMIRR